MTSDIYQGNPRLRSVRIDIEGKSRQFMTDNRKRMGNTCCPNRPDK